MRGVERTVFRVIATVHEFQLCGPEPQLVEWRMGTDILSV